MYYSLPHLQIANFKTKKIFQKCIHISYERDLYSGQRETRTTYFADRNQRPNQMGYIYAQKAGKGRMFSFQNDPFDSDPITAGLCSAKCQINAKKVFKTKYFGQFKFRTSVCPKFRRLITQARTPIAGKGYQKSASHR